MDLMKALTSQYMKEELPQMNVGDTVRVHVKSRKALVRECRCSRERSLPASMAALRSPSPSAA